MEEAHDLIELKELVARLGLKDDRRQSPRYNVEIAGKYSVNQGGIPESYGTCWLVDISKEGLAIKIEDAAFRSGTVLHLHFSMGSKTVDVASRAVHIALQEDGCIVGVQSLNENNDIINQLFSN